MPIFENVHRFFAQTIIYGLRNTPAGGRVPSEITNVSVEPNKVTVDYAFYYQKNLDVSGSDDIEVSENSITFTSSEDIKLLHDILAGEVTPHATKCQLILGKSSATTREERMKIVDFEERHEENALLKFLNLNVGYVNPFKQPRRLVQEEITEKIAEMFGNPTTLPRL